MIKLVKNKTIELNAICNKHHVALFYLFGSATNDTFNDESDLDFAVIFNEDLSLIDKGDAFFGLLDDLELLFNRKIDLISYKVIKNPIFKAEVDRTKIELYAVA